MQLHERLFDVLGDSFNNLTRWIETKVTSLFGSSNARLLKRLAPKVEAINALEPRYQAMSDDELRRQTELFRARLQKGETLDDLLVEAFAVCREAGRRVIGLRHYDVQLMGGMVLHSGAIAEMMTGEGKTLVATLPAYLNALEGKGVHVVTVNDYLARRDMEWMGPLYMSLGLTVGAIQGNMPNEGRQKAYRCDITYGTNNEFGFDYLRDNMRYAAQGDDRYETHHQQVQGRLHYAIIDEVDNILIDEARTPLIIAGPAHDDVSRYRVADGIARQLTKGVDFEVNEKEHSAHLTDVGIRKAEHLAGVESFYTAGNMEWPHLIDNALKAHHLYKLDVNYMIDGEEIVIVDEFTGRPMPGRNWSDGLHQAVEAKEKVRVKEENQTLATITLQNFFKLYDKIAGMTGTAMTEAAEFWKIYKLDVIAMPTNRDMKRLNHPDAIYRSEKEKYNAIVEEIERLNKWDILDFGKEREVLGTIEKETEDFVEFLPKGAGKSSVERIEKKDVKSISHKGRPILVGTVSIERSELISGMLDRRGIKHQVLNAKHHQREAEIISQAGRKGAVTIATNMAGRGTDIILGGNPETMAWGLLQAKYPTRLDVPQSEWNALVAEIEQREQMKPEGNVVRGMGGLHIIGTERHEARRIDLQLRGRCGRQGDPGSSRFFLSLEDDLMRIFAGEWVKKIMTMLGMEEGQAIESKMVSRRIEGAQKKVEERNFDVRKNLLEYDEVMDFQRKSVYGYRQRILDGANCKQLILSMIDAQIDRHLEEFLDKDYGTASFAAWAASQLGMEFEPKSFRSLSFEMAQEYALDQARRLSESQVLDALEENLPADAEESEWNWQALTKTANTQWKAALRESDLKKIGREDLADFLIEKAHHFIDRVDLSDGKAFLEPDFGVKTAVNWIKKKFDIEIDLEKAKEYETAAFESMLRGLTHAKYEEKEVQFPVLGGLLHYTIRDQNGKRYDREALVEWAKVRFGIDLSLDDLKNKQRQEIEETMFVECRKGLEVVPDKYRKLGERLDDLLLNQDLGPEEIRGHHESIPHPASPEAVSSHSERTSETKMVRLNLNDPHVGEFCRFLQEEFGVELTPEKLGQWDVRDLEDRLASMIEDRYNPEMRRMERSLVLQILDAAWKDHLLVMDHLRSSVGLRGYAQVDPKVEFKREGMRIFETMWDSIFERVTDLIFRMEQLDPGFVSSTWNESEAVHEEVASNSTIGSIAEQQEAAIEGSQGDKKPEPIRNRDPKVGRNDPCPCGSGKKYKNCCLKK